MPLPVDGFDRVDLHVAGRIFKPGWRRCGQTAEVDLDLGGGRGCGHTDGAARRGALRILLRHFDRAGRTVRIEIRDGQLLRRRLRHAAKSGKRQR